MFKNKMLTRKYCKLLNKLINVAATPEKENLIISDPKEIVMIQTMQILGIIGDCFKSNKSGHLVLQTERNLIPSLTRQILKELI